MIMKFLNLVKLLRNKTFYNMLSYYRWRIYGK
jgi:hypothetical protein